MTDVKRKGSQFERDAVKLLGKLIPNSEWRRMPSSGAMGTIMKEPLLGGDLVGKVDGILQTFRGEAKVGYGGEKTMTFQRAWLQGIKEEAERTFSIPFVIGKFSGSRGDIKEFVALDVKVFAKLVNNLAELGRELEANLEDVLSE